VRLHEIQCRANWNNPRGIDVVMGDVVVALDVVEVHRLRDAWLLINIHQVPLQAFIIHDAPNVALEVPVINRVEANKRAKEPPIRFDDSCSEKVSARGQARLQLIERLTFGPDILESFALTV